MLLPIFKKKGVKNIFKKTLIFITLTLVLLFGIAKPLESNAQGLEEPDYPPYAVDDYEHYWERIYSPIMDLYSPWEGVNIYLHDVDYYSALGTSDAQIIAEMTKDIVRAQLEYGQGDYALGYRKGYESGVSYVWGLVENEQIYNAKDVILGIFDAPLRILEKAFTFEVFGIEVYNIILFVITMGVVYFVWKRVKK